MNKLISIGECLIDFIPLDNRELSFQAKAGGAPANVCVCVSKLGGIGCYLGKLSTDVFSKFLLENMQKYKVNTDYVVIDGRYKTALAFVTLNENCDREFEFYRNNSCDLMLDESEVKEDMFNSGDILHFCSVGLVESSLKYAHIKAIKIAKEKGCTVSFDVNMRLNLWQNKESLINTIKEFLPYSDLVKVTDEELTMITDTSDEKQAIRQLFNIATNAKLIFVTKGEKGCSVYNRAMDVIVREAIDTKVIDTTGAGDCFIGSILYCLLYKQINMNIEDIRIALDFALKACSKVVSKYGAMEAMPTKEEMES